MSPTNHPTSKTISLLPTEQDSSTRRWEETVKELTTLQDTLSSCKDKLLSRLKQHMDASKLENEISLAEKLNQALQVAHTRLHDTAISIDGLGEDDERIKTARSDMRTICKEHAHSCQSPLGQLGIRQIPSSASQHKILPPRTQNKTLQKGRSELAINATHKRGAGSVTPAPLSNRTRSQYSLLGQPALTRPTTDTYKIELRACYETLVKKGIAPPDQVILDILNNKCQYTTLRPYLEAHWAKEGVQIENKIGALCIMDALEDGAISQADLQDKDGRSANDTMSSVIEKLLVSAKAALQLIGNDMASISSLADKIAQLNQCLAESAVLAGKIEQIIAVHSVHSFHESTKKSIEVFTGLSHNIQSALSGDYDPYKSYNLFIKRVPLFHVHALCSKHLIRGSMAIKAPTEFPEAIRDHIIQNTPGIYSIYGTPVPTPMAIGTASGICSADTGAAAGEIAVIRQDGNGVSATGPNSLSDQYDALNLRAIAQELIQCGCDLGKAVSNYTITMSNDYAPKLTSRTKILKTITEHLQLWQKLQQGGDGSVLALHTTLRSLVHSVKPEMENIRGNNASIASLQLDNRRSTQDVCSIVRGIDESLGKVSAAASSAVCGASDEDWYYAPTEIRQGLAATIGECLDYNKDKSSILASNISNTSHNKKILKSICGFIGVFEIIAESISTPPNKSIGLPCYLRTLRTLLDEQLASCDRMHAQMQDTKHALDMCTSCMEKVRDIAACPALSPRELTKDDRGPALMQDASAAPEMEATVGNPGALSDAAAYNIKTSHEQAQLRTA